ncbi:MAG: GTPase Era [Bacteroidales bacterium]|nr:GTPase Era [Bacteroidales bacterium]MBN2819196.1 GTPase Era [Bacteroidales bacterium]
MSEKIHKSGFVNILGNPNVGKSTLMNALVGEKLSIITSKAQTTRHRIQGIVNGEDFQIVYSDTPGILDPKYKLQESMLKFVNTAFLDADVILYVTDVVETADKHQKYITRLAKSEVPVLLLINKIDKSNQEEVENKVAEWNELLPNAMVIPISALEKFNISGVFDRVLELLPEGPPFYSKDELTDKSERFFVAEIIREKVLLNYQKEIPYSVEIEVESFKESEKLVKISAVIYVARDSQKGILIGKGGEMLKKVGTKAREDIEKFLDKKVFLELFVKVKKDWRNSDYQLKKFGYNG